ncbi:hypothetical protein Tco_1083418 [Tanacetum coccineum]
MLAMVLIYAIYAVKRVDSSGDHDSDDEGMPVKRVDSSGDHDSDDEVASVDSDHDSDDEVASVDNRRINLA